MNRPFQSRGSVTVPLLLSSAGNWSPETFIPLFVNTLRTRPRVTVSDTRAYDIPPRRLTQRTREREMPAPMQAPMLVQGKMLVPAPLPAIVS
jgi:hypothetical protein